MKCLAVIDFDLASRHPDDFYVLLVNRNGSFVLPHMRRLRQNWRRRDLFRNVVVIRYIRETVLLLTFAFLNGPVNDSSSMFEQLHALDEVVELEVGACLGVDELFCLLLLLYFIKVVFVVLRLLRLRINDFIQHVDPNEVCHVGIHFFALE